MGLKAYPSVADLPERADLAVLIIPAQHIAEELERCGKAGVRAAIILSSGFAEGGGEAGAGMQAEIRAIAQRYDMAVMGPNCEGFANTAANLCPTFSPAMEASDRPLLPAGRPRGQLAVIAQSGGIGFAFFDHGRAKELSYRYVVTTGNEACLEVLDFADFILDEGKTDALLMLLEDVKSPETFKRVAEKALQGRQAAHRQQDRPVAGRRAGGRLAHGRARRRVRRLPGDVPALRADRGPRHRRDGRFRRRASSPGARGCRKGRRVGICTASGGGGGWMADACSGRRPRGARARRGDAARSIDEHLPSYGTSQNPVDATAQAVSKIGYAGLADLVLPSPVIDGIVVVMTGAHPARPRAPARGARAASPPRRRSRS